MTLTTELTREGIVCKHKVYGEIATITYCTDGYWKLQCEHWDVCTRFRDMEFYDVKSAEYAALIIALELKAQGY